MKIIKVISCGVCPYNRIHLNNSESEWDDRCFLISQKVNPNTIHSLCPLDEYKDNKKRD